MDLRLAPKHGRKVRLEPPRAHQRGRYLIMFQRPAVITKPEVRTAEQPEFVGLLLLEPEPTVDCQRRVQGLEDQMILAGQLVRGGELAEGVLFADGVVAASVKGPSRVDPPRPRGNGHRSPPALRRLHHRTSVPHANYDISPDGRTFAMVRQNPATRIIVLQNMPALFRQLEWGKPR